MSNAQGTKAMREPVVERSFAASPDACASAVVLLLQGPCKQEKAAEGAHPDGRDDTEEPKNVRTVPN